MPLLCITLLALLLLPLSLSCNSKTLPTDVQDHYRIIIQTDISKANGTIATMLQNSSCPALKQKLHNCTSANMQDALSTLHSLTCKMKILRISHTDRLVSSVLNSLKCTCLQKPAKEPNVRSTMRTTRHRRNKQKISRRETKKLCKAEAIMSAMTICYQMLNSIQMDLRPNPS